MRRWAFALAIAAAIAAVAYFALTYEAADSPARSAAYVLWPKREEQSHFLRSVMATAYPIVFLDCPIGKTRGWQQWSPATLLREVGGSLGVHVSQSNRLVYHNHGRPMNDLAEDPSLIHGRLKDGSRPQVPRKAAYASASLPIADILHRTETQTSDPPFTYLSTNIWSLGRSLASPVFEALAAFVMPTERAMVLAKELLDLPDNEVKAVTGDQHVNVWLGGAGVTASLHYDTSHNFYFQQSGRKKFLLFPPTDHWAAYLHPSLHPYYRRSVAGGLVDAPAEETPDFPLFSRMSPMEFELKAGQVLYLPPYWLHHVTALDQSLSVNVWQNSEQFWEAEAAAAAPIPFDGDWSEDELTCATFGYLSHVIQRYGEGQEHREGITLLSDRLREHRVTDEGEENPRGRGTPDFLLQFLELLFHSRYENTLGVVPKSDPSLTYWLKQLARCPSVLALTDMKDESWESRLARGSSQLLVHFTAATSPPGVRCLLLANYAESLLCSFLGVAAVHPALQAWVTHLQAS